MKWMKLTVFPVFLFTTFLIAGCEEDEITDNAFYLGIALPMSGAQETPPVNTSATGTIDAAYDIYSKVLTYTIKWSGLSGVPLAAHIHGPATAGYAALPVQPLWTSPNPSRFPATGTYSGSLLVDGIVIKQENLLAGAYYVNLHTASNTGGEIRGQIILTRK